jgi:hypothetical protein
VALQKVWARLGNLGVAGTHVGLLGKLTQNQIKTHVRRRIFDWLGDTGFLEFLVHYVGAWRGQIRFDGLERRPSTDLHDDSWIHVLVHEKALCEASAEIVARNVVEVLLASL